MTIRKLIYINLKSPVMQHRLLPFMVLLRNRMLYALSGMEELSILLWTFCKDPGMLLKNRLEKIIN